MFDAAEKNVVVIVGTPHLQNNLLCQFIRENSRFDCMILPNISRFTDLAKTSLAAHLVLLDHQDRQLDNHLAHLHELNSSRNRLYFAVFNLPDHEQLKNISSWPHLNGAFTQDTPADKLLAGIASIFQGEIWLPRRIITELLQEIRRFDFSGSNQCDGLTSREIEVLKIMGTGAKNSDIANRLNLSTHTVKTHIYNIFKKIKASNRLQAVNWAKEHL